MCILVLCQHKCFFTDESFAFLIHSFFPSFFSSLSRHCGLHHHLFCLYSSLYLFLFSSISLQIQNFIVQLFLQSILFELWVDLLSFSVVTFFFFDFFVFISRFLGVSVRIRVRIGFHQILSNFVKIRSNSTVVIWCVCVCVWAGSNNSMLIISVVSNKLKKINK